MLHFLLNYSTEFSGKLYTRIEKTTTSLLLILLGTIAIFRESKLCGFQEDIEKTESRSDHLNYLIGFALYCAGKEGMFKSQANFFVPS